MSYADPFVPAQLQSGAPTKGEDCAIQTIIGGTTWYSRGGNVPTVAEVRASINKPTGGITVLQAKAAYTAQGIATSNLNTEGKVQVALKAGAFVHAAVNYAWVKANARYLSGQLDFTGLHAIGLFGFEEVAGKTWVRWLDPLHDGRKVATPKQIVMARLRDVTGAMAAMPSGVQGLALVQPTATDLGFVAVDSLLAQAFESAKETLILRAAADANLNSAIDEWRTTR